MVGDSEKQVIEISIVMQKQFIKFLLENICACQDDEIFWKTLKIGNFVPLHLLHASNTKLVN